LEQENDLVPIIPVNPCHSNSETTHNALIEARAYLDVLSQEKQDVTERYLRARMRWLAATLAIPDDAGISHHDDAYLALRQAWKRAQRDYHRYMYHKIPHQLALIRRLADSQVAPQREAWARENHPRLVETIAVAALAMESHTEGCRAWTRARNRWQAAQLKLLGLWEERDGGDDDAPGF
jgi:hypothetical protein